MWISRSCHNPLKIFPLITCISPLLRPPMSNQRQSQITDLKENELIYPRNNSMWTLNPNSSSFFSLHIIVLDSPSLQSKRWLHLTSSILSLDDSIQVGLKAIYEENIVHPIDRSHKSGKNISLINSLAWSGLRNAIQGQLVSYNPM